MGRDSIPGSPRSACAPGSGETIPGPARWGPRRGGIPIPSRVPMALIALGLIGLVASLGEDSSPKPARMRLIPGPPRGETIDFALSPDGEWVATISSDDRVSLRSLGDDPG